MPSFAQISLPVQLFLKCNPCMVFLFIIGVKLVLDCLIYITERLQHFNCHAFCGTCSIYMYTHVHVVMYIVDAYGGSLPNKVTANTEASVLSLCVCMFCQHISFCEVSAHCVCELSSVSLVKWLLCQTTLLLSLCINVKQNRSAKCVCIEECLSFNIESL